MDMRYARWIAIGAVLVAVPLIRIRVFSYNDSIPKEILSKKNPVTPSEATLARAKQNYEVSCLKCHGARGLGDGPMAGMLKEKPANLTDADDIGEMTDGEIYWTITKGHDPMPAFESKIPENERWGLVHLIRSLSNTKPNSTPRY
jgi:mono/diheme cytochrome c family protein